MVNYEKNTNGGVSFSKTINEGSLCEKDIQLLQQIGEHFNLTSHTEVIQVAIRQLMPSLQKSDWLGKELLHCQNQLALKDAALHAIEGIIQQILFSCPPQKR